MSDFIDHLKMKRVELLEKKGEINNKFRRVLNEITLIEIEIEHLERKITMFEEHEFRSEVLKELEDNGQL